MATESKKRIFVDMDGVLAKWNTNATLEDTLEKGYFLQREPQENMIEAIRDLAKSEDVTILSAVYPKEMSKYAASEKETWLSRNGLGSAPHVFVPYGANKRSSIKVSDEETVFLIDDYTKNLIEWESTFRSYGIKFCNGINDTNATWKGFRISKDSEAKALRVTLLSLLRYVE